MLGKKGTKWQRHIGTKGKNSPFEGGFRGMLAFTLIEVMITTAVLALLITGIYSIFKGGTDSWTKGNVRMERYQNARAILEMMSREISCAMVNEARKMHILGINDETGTRIKNDSIKDELFFVAPIHSTSALIANKSSDMCEIGYWLKHHPVAYPDTGLMRHYSVGSASGSRPDFVYKSSDGSDSLGVKATDLQFYYYYGECSEADSYSGTWDSTDETNDTTYYKLPKKIKIILKTQDKEKREAIQTFETTVFMPGAE